MTSGKLRKTLSELKDEDVVKAFGRHVFFFFLRLNIYILHF